MEGASILSSHSLSANFFHQLNYPAGSLVKQKFAVFANPTVESPSKSELECLLSIQKGDLMSKPTNRKVVTHHYSRLSSHWNEAFFENFGAAIISAGEEDFFFQDDQTRRFGESYPVQWLSPLLLTWQPFAYPSRENLPIKDRPVDYWRINRNAKRTK